MTTRRTGRWTAIGAVALALAGVGILARQPGFLVAGVVGVALAAVAQAARPPALELAVERTVDDARPAPGASVRVQVSVTNEGDSLLPDLRLVDGVPDSLAVEDGSPRHGTALRPGRTATFSYTVAASRGVHRFDPLLAIGRDLSGAAERRVEVTATTTIECVPPLPRPVDLPLRMQTTGVAGQVTTRDGGPGVAFHAVRDYRRGDPLNRIDWKRAARTGELSTVEFQRERSATVVVVVDARPDAYLAPTPDERSTVDRCVDATAALATGFVANDDLVGVAALSPHECWLAPGSGSTHRSRLRELLATHPALSPTPPDEPFFPTVSSARLRRRLPGDAQVVLCTPLCDEFPARLARRLEAHGHRVTVVSPDPTSERTPGGQLAGVERQLRAAALRERHIRVVDWAWEDDRLAAAVARAARRWSS